MVTPQLVLVAGLAVTVVRTQGDARRVDCLPDLGPEQDRASNEGPQLHMAFSWLKAATTAFTFKTLLRHYAKGSLTSHKGQAGWLAKCLIAACPL